MGYSMFRSIKLGRAFGIPLFLHWSFFLLPLYALYLTRDQGPAGILLSQAVLLSIFGCVMLHELGHALMARYFGIRTRDVTLYPIGGVARLESTGDLPHQELCIALAGPAVNLAIVILLSPLVVLALFWGILDPNVAPGTGGTMHWLAYLLTGVCLGNGILMLFNLIPAFPMDGGRVLRALLGMGMNHLRATEIAATVGLFAAGCLALAGLWNENVGLVLVSAFVAFAGQKELAVLRHREIQRRQAERPPSAVLFEQLLAEPVVDRPAGPAHTEGFTGLIWDRDNRIWVWWVNGRPVQIH
jgi:Zn-dependent protease